MIAGIFDNIGNREQFLIMAIRILTFSSGFKKEIVQIGIAAIEGLQDVCVRIESSQNKTHNAALFQLSTSSYPLLIAARSSSERRTTLCAISSKRSASSSYSTGVSLMGLAIVRTPFISTIVLSPPEGFFAKIIVFSLFFLTFLPTLKHPDNRQDPYSLATING